MSQHSTTTTTDTSNQGQEREEGKEKKVKRVREDSAVAMGESSGDGEEAGAGGPEPEIRHSKRMRRPTAKPCEEMVKGRHPFCFTVFSEELKRANRCNLLVAANGVYMYVRYSFWTHRSSVESGGVESVF